MNKPYRPLFQGCPRGITLLEVLISIGILSVGLISALSLIPVGRTYLMKAGIDDRAATVIPSAYGTMLAMGLFDEDSLSWIDDSDHSYAETEPSNEKRNDSPNKAEVVPLPPLGVKTLQGRAVFIASSKVQLTGRRWVIWDERMVDDKLVRIIVDLDGEDWYQCRVEAGQILTVEWGAGEEGNLQSDGSGRILPVYLNGTGLNNVLQPRQTAGSMAAYSIPRDGVVFLRVLPRADIVFDYSFSLELSRPDRVVAIDPLMASRLDKVLSLRGETMAASSAAAIRRRYFADFTQVVAGSGTSRAFRLPRLTWQTLASPSLDDSLALADNICRLRDDIEVDDAVISQQTGARDEFAAPRPAYVRDTGGAMAYCRKSTGRMSWLLTLQPQAAGSVRSNWEPGNIFDASIVVFQDRELPSIDKDALVMGELTFSARWSELEGMLFIDVPQPMAVDGEDRFLDDEDVRALFRGGSWILLAPLVAYDAPPIEDRQRLAWVRAQTVEVEKVPSGMTVRVLPADEPPRDALGSETTSGVFPLVAIVHGGVVAVVTKQVQIQSP
jgi:hypothetical protein